MCTGLSFTTEDHYFGRNLDLEVSYGETVTVTPRGFPFEPRRTTALPVHHAIVGIATVVDGYPLYYDATNEKGLSAAGLNFPGNAYYPPEGTGAVEVTPFELIPWLLGRFETVAEVTEALRSVSLVDIPFSESLPLTPLHWIVADRSASITVESVRGGLAVYDNPYGVLTNNPTFDVQSFRLNDYRHLSRRQPENTFAPELALDDYSRGMGGLGLPGDLSSSSRFVRAVFTRMNSVCGTSESESVAQFFQILGSVAQQRGCVQVGDRDDYEITIYSSCCNTDRGLYYYRTYENSQVTVVDMHREDLDGTTLSVFPLITEQQVAHQN